MITPHTGPETVYNDGGANWLTLASLMVSEESSSKSQVVEQIITATRELNWPVESLAKFRQTLLQAIQNILDRGLLPGMLTARVFVHQMAETATQPLENSIRAGRSWGFFFVQKSEKDAALTTAPQQDEIELYLYQE